MYESGATLSLALCPWQPRRCRFIEAGLRLSFRSYCSKEESSECYLEIATDAQK